MTHKTVSPKEAIKRLADFCQEKGYDIKTSDITAQGLIEAIDTEGKVEDWYTVTKQRNGLTVPIAEGSLVELVVMDFNLLEPDEKLVLEWILVRHDFEIPRSDYVRQPYNRERRK